jgi:serine/threonine-protein kinase
VVQADLSGHPEALARFLARDAGDHLFAAPPNIVQVTDFNVTPAGHPYLVMELLEGEDLARHLGRPLPLPWVLDVVGQLASGLGAAHARGLVHGDTQAAEPVHGGARGARPRQGGGLRHLAGARRHHPARP